MGGAASAEPSEAPSEPPSARTESSFDSNALTTWRSDVSEMLEDDGAPSLQELFIEHNEQEDEDEVVKMPPPLLEGNYDNDDGGDDTNDDDGSTRKSDVIKSCPEIDLSTFPYKCDKETLKDRLGKTLYDEEVFQLLRTADGYVLRQDLIRWTAPLAGDEQYFNDVLRCRTRLEFLKKFKPLGDSRRGKMKLRFRLRALAPSLGWAAGPRPLEPWLQKWLETKGFSTDPRHVSTTVAIFDDGLREMTPLCEACFEGSEYIARRLLYHGSKDKRDVLQRMRASGNTALHYACMGGHVPVVNWLCEVLKSRCTVEEDSEDSESESESESNTDGEDLDARTAARDPKGFASSSFDASLGRASRLCLAPNATGITPLMLASMEGHEAVVESILDQVLAGAAVVRRIRADRSFISRRVTIAAGPGLVDRALAQRDQVGDGLAERALRLPPVTAVICQGASHHTSATSEAGEKKEERSRRRESQIDDGVSSGGGNTAVRWAMRRNQFGVVERMASSGALGRLSADNHYTNHAEELVTMDETFAYKCYNGGRAEPSPTGVLGLMAFLGAGLHKTALLRLWSLRATIATAARCGFEQSCAAAIASRVSEYLGGCFRYVGVRRTNIRHFLDLLRQAKAAAILEAIDEAEADRYTSEEELEEAEVSSNDDSADREGESVKIVTARSPTQQEQGDMSFDLAGCDYNEAFMRTLMVQQDQLNQFDDDIQ